MIFAISTRKLLSSKTSAHLLLWVTAIKYRDSSILELNSAQLALSYNAWSGYEEGEVSFCFLCTLTYSLFFVVSLEHARAGGGGEAERPAGHLLFVHDPSLFGVALIYETSISSGLFVLSRQKIHCVTKDRVATYRLFSSRVYFTNHQTDGTGELALLLFYRSKLRAFAQLLLFLFFCLHLRPEVATGIAAKAAAAAWSMIR